MRPGKSILLVGDNEATLAPLRFVLRNTESRKGCSCYAVTTAVGADEAYRFLADGSFDLMLVQLPVTPMEPFLERANGIDGTFPVIVLKAIARPPMAEILERIKVMTACKRGPRKGSHQAMRCGQNKRDLRVGP